MLPVLRTNGSMASSTLEGPVNRLSNLFDRFFNHHQFAPQTALSAVAAVPLSVWADEDHFHVELDAPGMSEQDIDVSIHNGELIIRGERKCPRRGTGCDTRAYGHFEQRIRLPNWAKADQVEARLTQGVLSLAFPKGEEARPKKICVQSE